MQNWFTEYFSDIGHPCYDQLTPVKTRYPLTRFMLPYRGLKFIAHRGHGFFEVDRCPSSDVPLDRRLMSDLLVENWAGLFGRRLMLTQD